MTPAQYADKLRKQLNAIQTVNKPLQLAAYSVTAQAAKRIFTDGETNTGERFKYTSKAYIKKREERTFRTNYVNWTFEGDLKSDYENRPKGSNNPVTARKIDVNEYCIELMRPENQAKYRYLQDRYGDNFLELSDNEVQEFYRILEGQLTLLLNS